MRDELEILKEISNKLNLILALLKLSNKDFLDRFQRDLKKDAVSSKILELADGTLTYSELSKKVAKELKVAEITVKRKISTLRNMGFLIAKRKGKEVYYESSGLIGLGD